MRANFRQVLETIGFPLHKIKGTANSETPTLGLAKYFFKMTGTARPSSSEVGMNFQNWNLRDFLEFSLNY